MRREWEIRRERGGWFRVRRRTRWIGGPILIGLLILVGGGAVKGLWDRFTVWLWDTAHLAPTTVFAAGVITFVLVTLWKTNR